MSVLFQCLRLLGSKVFVLIGLLIVFVGVYQSNALEYSKKKYLERRNKEFYGKVILKREKGDYIRARRSVVLDSHYEQLVYNELYYKIQIGDSICKNKGNDSIFYYLKSGEIIIDDYCKHLREKYESLLITK